MYSFLMMHRKVSTSSKKLTVALVLGLLSLSTPSYADIVIGYNTDGTPKYGPDPQGATGPIATPEKPAWIPQSDGTPTQAQRDYTFIPNAEENAKKIPEPTSSAPPGMVQLGFNTDGTPIYGPEPKGATEPIATPENPTWIKNPDGTPTAAELAYTFLPNAEEKAAEANLAEMKSVVEKEISSSTFTKVKKGSTYTLTSNVEISSTSASIKVIAVKKGSANKKISFTYSEDGQLVLKASQKLKGYQVQIISDEKILKKITL
jgi:hypothetical protein